MPNLLDPSQIHRLATSPAIGPFLASMGLAVWLALSALGGFGDAHGFRLREAWDTSAYFYLGLPLMALAVTGAAFLQPHRTWRWPLWLVGGHQAGVLLLGVGMQSGLSLVLLTAMLAVLLAAFFTVPAGVGYALNRYVIARAY